MGESWTATVNVMILQRQRDEGVEARGVAHDHALGELERASDSKADSFYFTYTAPGQPLATGLQAALAWIIAAPLADEVRGEVVRAVSRTGGHLSSNLGTVELTVALHHVFNTPHDRLVWDVGHQTYGHKILTGRREQMNRLRMKDGLAGFPRREESEFDTFGTAHSSTSISAALGMAVASKLRGEERQCIAIIGDGAMTAGMAFEAMNNAGDMDVNLLVILMFFKIENIRLQLMEQTVALNINKRLNFMRFQLRQQIHIVTPEFTHGRQQTVSNHIGVQLIDHIIFQ